MPARRLNGREAEVVAGYESGASVDELAATFGVSHSPIRRILIAARVQMRPTGRAPAPKPDLAQLAAAYRRGETMPSLSRTYGWDSKTIKKWLIGRRRRRPAEEADPR